MKRYKDLEPAETVSSIKRILEGLGIHLQEKLYDVVGFYSCRISDSQTGCGTNGKGASEELSLASGYGEFMERLQNDCLVGRLHNSFEDRPGDEFQSWPDEQLVSADEALAVMQCLAKDLVSAYIPADDVMTEQEAQDKAIAFLLKNIPEKTILLPYYRMGTGTCVMVPDDIVSFVCATNGLSSGNTPEEALVEAMSEICERYAKYRILNNELCMPKISRAFLEEYCPEQSAVIERIKQETGLKVFVMDASLGCDLPVVAALFVDQTTGRYRLKFGAHPVFKVAMERCMTEYFQGANKNNLKKTLVAWNSVTRKGAHNLEYVPFMFSSDSGPVPDRLFMAGSDWDFKPWGIDNNYSNKAGARYLAHKLKEISGEVYIRSTGYLGVPAFRIFVPGVTVIPRSQGESLMELADMLSAVGHRLGIALSEYERGNLRAASLILSQTEGTRHLCAAQELICREEGMPEEQRDELLRLYFGEGALAYVKACWRAESVRDALIGFQQRERAILGRPKPERIHAGKKKMNKQQYDACLEIFLKLKRRKAENPLDQMAVKDLID